MRKFLLFVFILTTLTSIAQPYGNEWIDYTPGKKYFKMQVAQNGLYRINYSTLQFALQSISEDIANIDPRSLQVYNRGKEIHLYVEGEADGVFNSGDYLEFYGEKNTGWLDESLYPSPAAHSNPYYSLISDTNAYFLTWKTDGSFSAKRYVDVPFGTPAPSPLSYVWEEIDLNFKNEYVPGPLIGGEKGYTEYKEGEGWSSGKFGYKESSGGSAVNGVFNDLRPYTGTSAPNAIFETALAGYNAGAGQGLSNAHHAQLRIGSTVLKDVIYATYGYVRPSVEFSPTLLSESSSLNVYTGYSVSQVDAANDFSSCFYMKLKYPRSLDFGNKASFLFQVPASAGVSYLNASNFSTSPTHCIYDLDNHLRLAIDHNQATGSVKTNVPAGTERRMFIASEAAVKTIAASGLKPVNGNGEFQDFMDMQTDSAYLIITHKKLWNTALTYRSHRMQGYHVVLVDVDDLYDQFSYGINKHPLSIRHFLEFCTDKWPSPPSHLFLLGKGVAEREYRKSPAVYAENLVPTMANPPSDVLLSAGINGSGLKPTISTGRLPAQSPSDVNTYLAKVQEYEYAQRTDPNSYTINNRLWQKHILHFAGGGNKSENDRFKNYLKSYARHMEDGEYAAKVYTFSKTTTDVIEEFNSDSARLMIKNGASLMVFFGHGSGSSFDLAIDDPGLWGNSGKYPLMLANSCYSGNIHRPSSAIESTSELCVLIPKQGAIGFIATPDVSFETGLSSFTLEFHRRLGLEEYGSTIGEAMLNTARQLIGSNSVNNTVALEMTLNGDPALKLNPHQKTELTINDPVHGPALRFQPELLTNDLDSFDLMVDISNLGRRADETFYLTVEREFPDGSREEYIEEINGAGYKNTVKLTLPLDEERSIGENIFHVNLDNSVPVLDEFIKTPNNEILNYEKRVTSNDLFPVFPYDFSIVPDLDLTLKASIGDPLADERNYRLQIDTTDLYSSPSLDTIVVTQTGGVVKWKPDLSAFSAKDSVVFFWRASPADTNKWREFSFQYIPGQRGWAQDHFFQYKNNDFDLLDYNRQGRGFSFLPTYRELLVNNIGNPNTDQFTLSSIGYTLDGQTVPMGDANMCQYKAAMAIVVIDSNDLLPWGTYYVDGNGNVYNEGHQFGNNNDANGNNCGRYRPSFFFSFWVDNPSQMDAMADMITNQVEDGHYIVAYTHVRGNFQNPAFWKEHHFAAFEALGADSIRFVPNDRPYIFAVKKGDPSTAEEVIGNSSDAHISLRKNLYTTIRFGEMETDAIGPAREWKKLRWSQSAKEQANTAEVADVSVIGIRKDRSEKELFSIGKDITEHHLSWISAYEYPYLRLKYYTRDNDHQTPAILKNWHVLYEPVPESALNAAFKYHFHQKEIQAGDKLQFAIAIENISDLNFDSLRVTYALQEKGGDPVFIDYPKQEPLKAGQIIFDTITISTRSLSGNYSLHVEVNPEDAQWQPEQFHFNNLAYQRFKVKNDNLNPLLDVTFDGIHILDGDIVAPSPMIVMELKDENNFLTLDDTSSFDVFLTDPNGIEKRVPFMQQGKEIMQFLPPKGKKNKARVEFKPEPLEDGTYTLKVAARDASGNEAGKNDYKISFEVINRSTITEVMNYPNPFSTSTRFVFTLTGSVVPEVFTIQILTVTGKVVREITRNELGHIRIGRNISQYAWDGRDEYGDKLAKGIYLYRVITKINGEEVEHRGSGADSYFHKGFGKIYLF